MGYWTEQAGNLPGQAVLTLSTKDEDPGFVPDICLRFTDPLPFVPQFLKPPSQPLESLGRDGEFSQDHDPWVGALKTLVHLFFWCVFKKTGHCFPDYC